ncbi:ABC transporter permease [Ornithinibacillus sp. BX22]|uniref:Cell division protein FtsX n=2 Tax=Ornithinibacillus TaxID=484508 RepID=A0A923L7D4_9BACI|nr:MULTISPECIES: permease-like cell division protein FtsX [Ornithinibacillus]MBC5637887.1 ABC transporter permease [Ornithinibacillus hominis]MBS3681749.1 permease-like cell division protein FtsX [Ornithinibacillus massiliensis]
MKARTIKRHFREGAKNIYRNGWMTVASVGAVTVTLLLVGAFLGLILNLNHMAKKVEEDVVVKVLIDLAADDEQVIALGKEIEKIPGVASVVFSSKDDELNSLIDSMGEGGDVWGGFKSDNPLNHAYIVKADEPQETTGIAKTIAELDGVDSVTYGEDVAQNLFKFTDYARTIGIILIAGLVLTAIFLISNTIKLTIMARSREIGIMKLVGATNGFIRGPFFIEGLLLGVLGSIIPISAVLGGYKWIESSITTVQTIGFVEVLPFNPFAWQLALIILVIGAGIGMWGSLMSVRKFLKV